MELRKRQAKILQDLFEKKRISVDTILDDMEFQREHYIMI